MIIDHENKILDFTKTNISHETRDLGEGVTENVEIISKPWTDKVTLKECYSDSYEIIGFLGGVEIKTSELEDEIPETIVPRIEGEPIPKWGDMPHHLSKNDNKSMLYICDAMPFETSWSGASSERFYEMVDIFGINKVETKSSFFDLFKSDEEI